MSVVPEVSTNLISILGNTKQSLNIPLKSNIPEITKLLPAYKLSK